MDERPFGVHEVEFPVETGPRLGDDRIVGQHADGSRHRRETALRHAAERLRVNADLNKPDTSLESHARKDLGDKP